MNVCILEFGKWLILLRNQRKFGNSPENKTVVFLGICKKSSSSINSITLSPVILTILKQCIKTVEDTRNNLRF